MQAGRVRQIAAPRDLYEYPNCRFVADFIGKMNLFEAVLKSSGGGEIAVSVEGIGDLRLPHDGSTSGDIGIAVRPEKATVTAAKPESGDAVALEGSVLQVAYHGDESHVFVRTDSGLTFSVTLPNQTRTLDAPARPGDRRWVSWRQQDTLVLVD